MTCALVVAAHPDDEVLGCGGTIAKMADAGWFVHVLILAEGVTSRASTRSRSANVDGLSELRRCAIEAGRILGVQSVELEDFADNRMDAVDLLDVVKRIEVSIERLKPRRVLTHHVGDVNVDHSVVHHAVAAACRPLPGSCVREVLYYETVSSTEWRTPHSAAPFNPHLFIDIEASLQRKLLAVDAYVSEMRPFPHPRSVQAIEHLARWRGATVGRTAAEAFEIGRWIE